MDSCNPRFSGLENKIVVLFFTCPPLTWKGLCTSGKPPSSASIVTQNSRYHVRGHSQLCRNIYILYRPPGALARSNDLLGSPCSSLKTWLSKWGRIWSRWEERSTKSILDQASWADFCKTCVPSWKTDKGSPWRLGWKRETLWSSRRWSKLPAS